MPYTLTYDDGRVDGFDEHGNLVNRVDRFGNRTQLTWEQLRGRPVAADDHRRRLRPDDHVHLHAHLGHRHGSGPLGQRRRPTTVTLDDQQRVKSVKDPTGATASSATGRSPGRPRIQLLTSAVSAAQARTTITYTTTLTVRA